MDTTVSRLVERAVAHNEVIARASRDLSRDGARHPNWWAGDPLNCANCALMLEQAEDEEYLAALDADLAPKEAL